MDERERGEREEWNYEEGISLGGGEAAQVSKVENDCWEQ